MSTLFFHNNIKVVNMDKKQLYKRVWNACVGFSVYGKKNVEEKSMEMLPELSEFYEEILKENTLQLEKTDFDIIRKLFITIIKDFFQGLKNKDIILLEDTMEYGLLPFLELFIDDTEVQRMKEESMNE